jgi:BolA protein
LHKIKAFLRLKKLKGKILYKIFSSSRVMYTKALSQSDFIEWLMKLEQQLIERLQTLTPTHLEVLNESAGHGGYFPGKESHFKVIVVSEEFQGLRLVQRHQKIYAVAAELMSPGKIHALAIHAYVASEWQGQAPASPECAHAPKS